MFGKLMKHEWRATATTQGILALAALGAAVLAGLILRLGLNAGNTLPDALEVSMAMSVAFMLLGMVGCAVAMIILLIVRFYKNKFTDEGYLTFTLPVTSHQIFLSAGLNACIWSLISALVMLLGFALFLLIGISGQVDGSFQNMMEGMEQTFDGVFPENYGTLMLIQLLLSIPYSVTLTMTCITVGATLAKKHKILAAFGIYYGISWLYSIFGSILSAVLFSDTLSSYYRPDEMIQKMTNITSITAITWEVALIIGGYLLSTHMMNKKLNLP